MRNIIKIASAFALVLTLMLSMSAFAQEVDCREWTMDEYNAKMADLQKRETDAKTEIAAIETAIAELNEKTAAINNENGTVWGEIYTSLETNEAGVKDFGASLSALESNVDGLAALSPEELFQRRKEIDQYEEEISER